MSQYIPPPPTTVTAANGGVPNLRMVSASTTAAYGDILIVDATAGPVTITLPASQSGTAQITIKKYDSTANAVNIVSPGGTIDGNANTSIVTQNTARAYVNNGTNWMVL